MKLSKKEKKVIYDLVEIYKIDLGMINTFLNQVKVAFDESEVLKRYTHSIKWRLKEPSHLENKLIRKLIDAKSKKEQFGIDKENLYKEINDLAGIRILHLHTKQIRHINKILIELFENQNYILKEGPFARTWDDESREFFKSIGIKTENSPSMYTSVHYVIEANSKTKYTCEVQVRTLMEEVWGEVNHSINYPDEVQNLPCKEQIKTLARVTSSCSRLVDSIYATYDDYKTTIDLNDSSNSK